MVLSLPGSKRPSPLLDSDLIVKAFNELGLPLRIVGKGPELQKLKALAESNIEFEESVTEQRLWELYRNCAAFLFAAEEDFGMTPSRHNLAELQCFVSLKAGP